MGVIKRLIKLALWFTLIPWFLHIFSAGFHDIPKASGQLNEKGGMDFLYIAAWIFTFPLMMGLTLIWAFFTSLSWVFSHPNFIKEMSDELVEMHTESKYVKCVYCAELVRAEATICKHCGSEI